MRFLGRAGVGLLVPLGAYYLMRVLDIDVYLALLASAVISAVPTVLGLVRRRRIDALSAFFTTLVLGSVAVGLVAGDTRFLLAKDAVLTGVTGMWFLISAGTEGPLAYLMSKPLLEGRFRWPSDWATLWATSPRWRRMWRTSSVLFGIGTLADAVLRVVFAYSLPADAVPALATTLYAATSVALIVLTSVFYALCGVYNPRSALYADTDEHPVRRHGGYPDHP